MTVGVCSICGKAFETTEEDAGDPECACTECFVKEREKNVVARFEVTLLKFENGVCCIDLQKHDKTLDSVGDFAGGHSYSDSEDVIVPAFYAAQSDVDRRIDNAGMVSITTRPDSSHILVFKASKEDKGRDVVAGLKSMLETIREFDCEDFDYYEEIVREAESMLMR